MTKKKRILEKESEIGMKKCKAVRTILDEAIRKLPKKQQKELSDFVREKEELLKAHGKELGPTARHSIIVLWYNRKRIKIL